VFLYFRPVRALGIGLLTQSYVGKVCTGEFVPRYCPTDLGS